MAGVAAAVLGCVAGLAAMWWADPFGFRQSGLSPRFDYHLDSFLDVDPALIQYRQTAELPVGFDMPRAIAVDADDRVFVAGDRAVESFGLAGGQVSRIELDAEPRCLGVDAERLYVGMKDHVEVFSTEAKEKAKRLAAWPSLGPKALLTSIAVGEEDVFAADAGNRVVHRFDKSGKPVGKLGNEDPRHEIPMLVIPSPYFDVAWGSDGLLRVVNPGRHAIEHFTPEGEMESPLTWGTAGETIEAFCGCCNPVSIAVLPDGRLVTAEKGIPRVKVYDAKGRFECVVVGPRQLTPTTAAVEEAREEHKLLVVDLAVDGRGRVLVLDPARKAVRVFERVEGKEKSP